MVTPEKLEQVAYDVEVSDCATAGLLRAAARRIRELEDDRGRALAALWTLRMAAERWTSDTPDAVFANQIVHIAKGGMAGARQEAQTLAAESRQFEIRRVMSDPSLRSNP